MDIISTLISSATTLGNTFFGHILKKREKEEKSANAAEKADALPGRDGPQNFRSSFAHLVDGPVYAELLKSIESVPPFQRDGVHNSFVGLRVSWHVKLWTISRFEKLWMVTARSPHKGPLYICDSSPEACAHLVTAPENTEMIVSGRIKSISAAEVELSDCTFDVGSNLKSEARQFRADERMS
jgi:hypothetical protein